MLSTHNNRASTPSGAMVDGVLGLCCSARNDGMGKWLWMSGLLLYPCRFRGVFDGGMTPA